MKKFFNKKLTFTVKEILISGIIVTIIISSLIIGLIFSSKNNIANFLTVTEISTGRIILFYIPIEILLSFIYNIFKCLIKGSMEKDNE